MEALLKWAAAKLTSEDIILLEAGSNSFEVCKRLGNLGLRACVLESAHIGKHAKTYADNDKMAAACIALVYLAGNAPCVWVPDEQSRERRELLHACRKSVGDHTAAINRARLTATISDNFRLASYTYPIKAPGASKTLTKTVNRPTAIGGQTGISIKVPTRTRGRYTVQITAKDESGSTSSETTVRLVRK